MPCTPRPSPPLLLILFLLSSFQYCCSVAHEDTTSHLVANLSRLIPADTCSTPEGSSNGGRRSLRISHKYGPCSPLGGKLSNREVIGNLLLEDKLRYASLEHQLHPSLLEASKPSLPVRRGLSLHSGNYLVTVGVGTPPKDQIVVFDTGSTLSWVQCRPCLDCYRQSLPLFDPAASSSYHNISCSASSCTHLNAKGCSSGRCLYGIHYGDGSTSTGFLAQESLKLTSTDVFRGFLFGCGQRNRGLFGETSGVLGLSRGSLSLASQTSKVFRGVFSYCLPLSQSSTGELTFGPKAKGAGSPGASTVVYTPMIANSRAPGLYFVELKGISVGGQLLPIQPEVFSTGGTLIDSGTVITRLPPTSYGELRSAFRSAMAANGYPMGEPLGGLLDTCYDMTERKEFKVPTVALHLGGGAVVKLPAEGILFLGGPEHVCLAFAPNRADSSVGVIGNTQQRTMEVVYDLAGKRIGFGRGSCSARLDYVAGVGRI